MKNGGVRWRTENYALLLSFFSIHRTINDHLLLCWKTKGERRIEKGMAWSMAWFVRSSSILFERSSSLLHLIERFILLFIEEFVFPRVKSMVKCESWTEDLNSNFLLHRKFRDLRREEKLEIKSWFFIHRSSKFEKQCVFILFF